MLFMEVCWMQGLQFRDQKYFHDELYKEMALSGVPR